MITTWAIVALAAAAVLVYTYAGYPVLVAICARLRPRRRQRRDGWEPTVSVILPVSNSSAFVDGKLASLQGLDWPKDKLQIVVYSDGSTDDTVARVKRAAAADPRIVLVEAAERRGKPTAINAMAKVATGEVLLMTDARQPIVPGALRALVAALADPGVGCAAGHLVMRGATGAGAYWKYEKWIRDNEARFRSMVGVSGALYAVRRADLGELPEALILDDMWVPMRLRLQGRDIVFVPEAEFYDDAFDDDKEFKRKVRTLAGNYQLLGWMPRLLVPFVNPSWFELMSHKVLRLVCPWALLVLAAATVAGLASGALAGGVDGVVRSWAALVLALAALGQLGFYGAAVLGRALPGPLGKIGALARTFVVLNAAAVVGLWRWATGGQRVTW